MEMEPEKDHGEERKRGCKHTPFSPFMCQQSSNLHLTDL